MPWPAPKRANLRKAPSPFLLGKGAGGLGVLDYPNDKTARFSWRQQ